MMYTCAHMVLLLIYITLERVLEGKCISLNPDEEANEVVCSNLLSLTMNGSVYYGSSTGGIQMLINLFLKPPYWEVYSY